MCTSIGVHGISRRVRAAQNAVDSPAVHIIVLYTRCYCILLLLLLSLLLAKGVRIVRISCLRAIRCTGRRETVVDNGAFCGPQRDLQNQYSHNAPIGRPRITVIIIIPVTSRCSLSIVGTAVVSVTCWFVCFYTGFSRRLRKYQMIRFQRNPRSKSERRLWLIKKYRVEYEQNCRWTG